MPMSNMMMVRFVSLATPLPLLMLLLLLSSLRMSSVHSFPAMHTAVRGRRRNASLQRMSTTHTSQHPPPNEDESSSTPPLSPAAPPPQVPPLYRLLSSYTLHWEGLLRREHQEAVAELRSRRASYSRAQLEASGLAVLDATASPESELYGEKIVRVTIRDGAGDKKLREKFKRGDALVLTPRVAFRGKEVPPREGLVMDVGHDYLTLGVGASWPAGLMEMRKHYDYYGVRLDRSPSSAPLRAQLSALDVLRKGEAGSVAEMLVSSFYKGNGLPSSLGAAGEAPSHFDYLNGDLDGQIVMAMEKAVSQASFEPNASQREAVLWALGRKLGCIRGPPGTGKTRCSALLISTALKMELEKRQDGTDPGVSEAPSTPRILAVTHSNGAADVLLESLLRMGVPAVRAGRPASVSESVRHRTIAALSERMPEVSRLRQQAGDVALDRERRQSAVNDAKRCMADAQSMIARSALVVVASCVGAQQLLSIVGENDRFPIVVLDEAGQTTEPALICALAAARASQVILVGDTKQLPPTVAAQDAELRRTLGISPMERLLENGVDEFVLREQYRMPPSLLCHPNKYFYDGVVRCATKEGGTKGLPPPDGFPWPSSEEEPLAFLEVGNDSEVSHNFGGRSNPAEVEVIIDIVEKVIAAGDISAENIAIITPYNKQVQLFRTELSSVSSSTRHDTSRVQVGTVDSFQGQETDLVLFSAVRSNSVKELGFLRDERRLNVAITRARRGLIVVGDPSVLRSCRHWAALLESCSDRGCTLTLEDYKSNGNIEATAFLNVEKRNLSDVGLDKNDVYYGLFSDP